MNSYLACVYRLRLLLARCPISLTDGRAPDVKPQILPVAAVWPPARGFIAVSVVLT